MVRTCQSATSVSRELIRNSRFTILDCDFVEGQKYRTQNNHRRHACLSKTSVKPRILCFLLEIWLRQSRIITKIVKW